MRILDLFRPRWRHSKWEMREAAIATLTDQAVLVRSLNSDRVLL